MSAVDFSALGSAEGGEWALLLPITATVTSWVIDTAPIPSAVRRYNERYAVTPTLGMDQRVGARIEIRW